MKLAALWTSGPPSLAHVVSVRNFERVFTRELGVSPGRYVLQMRVEAARRMLEGTRKGLEQIALACGFSSADAMRHAFVRTLRMTPLSCRRQLNGPQGEIGLDSSSRNPI
jgi:transcriptional regulator GlxA family with amidase domain